jgi:K+-transporting ATPase ATPase A chain
LADDRNQEPTEGAKAPWTRRIFRGIREQGRLAVILFLVFTVLTGVVYPLLVTGVAQVAFPHEANGSMIVQNGKVVGSDLIGQPFSDPKYFWGRLSATPGFPYNASLSSGSNLGPLNPALTAAANARIEALHAVDPNNTDPIPVDLVTASGSGLDPDISLAAAQYQAARVAHFRNLTTDQVLTLVDIYTDERALGVMGERTVRVLELNLALDRITAGTQAMPSTAPEAPVESAVTTFLSMRIDDWAYLAVFFVILLVLVIPLGRWIARVIEGEPHLLSRFFDWGERSLFSWTRADRSSSMGWKTYALSFLLVNFVGFLFLFTLLLAQGFLPLNPSNAPGMTIDQAFNTAISFVSNTNWQSYGGETGASHLTQMIGLTVQNFLSAASAIAVLMAFIRGLRGRTIDKLGNFWVDLTRAVFILLVISFLMAIVLISQGTPQTLSGPVATDLVQPVVDVNNHTITQQLIPVGPIASQEAIKMLGTNGGGFFNANSAHPFENPSALTNLLQILMIAMIPAALCYTFGRMVKDSRQGWALLIAMLLILVAFLGLSIWAEMGGNPALAHLNVNQVASEIQPGGNMEGKEMRFGVVPSCLFSVVTTSVSCGAVNSMHDSYTAIGGLVPMALMQFGEVVLGGVGSGLYGMLVFVIIANFIAGLMIGRMPEYLGNKIGPWEMKLSVWIILLPIVTILAGTAIALLTDAGKAGIFNPGPHGLSEVLYAFTSASQNNGSAFAGISVNTPFYNIGLGLCMFIGRYPIAVLTLALAGAIARKKRVPVTPGTLPTHTPLFIVWLIGIIVLLGVLSFLCALALGPIAEFLLGGG